MKHLLLISLFLSFHLSLSAPLRPLIQLPQSTDQQEQQPSSQLHCDSWRLAVEANNLAPWKQIPSECGDYVREYVTGRAYGSDLEMVTRQALDHARTVEIKDDGLDAWVFDVDETLVSNLPYYTDHGFGLELFNANEFDTWVEKAIAPAIESSLVLYEEVKILGFKIILLTGRSENHMDVTVENLKKVGFSHWDKLILRGVNDRGKTATVYKSEKRREIEADGFRIHGNSGDQWSDLLGSNMSIRSFKLPNPMYFIP